MRGATVVKVVLAWTPFWAVYALVGVVHGGQPVGEAVFIATCTVGSAAVLAVGVWWLTGRYVWPARLRLRFYASHLALGVLYAICWLALYDLLNSLLSGGPLVFEALSMRMIGWQLLMGIWLYGLVAGVSYAVRIQERLLHEERVAARAEAVAARARLTALRAQLNPHFLFNALHSLATLIRHNTTAAERAVEQLGQLLRYSLDESDSERVRLAEEWAFTSDYLALERLRLNHPLELRAQLDDAAMDCLVLPFTVQPLVENAVRHGFDAQVAASTITVTAAAADGRLLIQVCDNGPGAEDVVERPEAIGLRSLRERLDAAYGDGAALSFCTAPGEGFCATVEMPADSDEASSNT